MKFKAITMLGLAGVLLAVSAPGSLAQTVKQASPAFLQPTPRPAHINKKASQVEAAADTTLLYYNPFSNKLFDVTLRRMGNTVVRAVGVIFEAPFDGALDRVDFELSNFPPSPGVAGTGKLRIKLIEFPFIVTDPPFQPGDSVDVDFSELKARNFIGGSGAFINQVDVSNDDFEITEGEQYFLQLALAEESNDAALTFVFDQGSDDPTNTDYYVPPDLGARSLIYLDSLGTQVNNCGNPAQLCDDFVSLRDPADTSFTHLNVFLELQLSKATPPPPPAPIALMQFVHNVPGAGMVDVYVGDSLVVEDIDYREASFSGGLSFVIVPAGEQTLNLVAATDPDNANPIFSKTINLAENRQYWAVALGTPGQNLDVAVSEKMEVRGEMGTVAFAAVHAAGGADPIDLNLLDETPQHAVAGFIADDLAFGQFAKPVPLTADSTFNVEVATGSTQLDVFRLEVAAGDNGGGGIFTTETILLLTSGIVGGDPALTLLTVDAEGNVGMPPVSTATEDFAVPDQFALHGNFPNPFNPTTTIRFDLGAPAFTTLTVYNLLGQEVARLVAAPLAAGAYEMAFDAAALPSGPYLYRLTSGRFSQQRMLMLVK